MYFNDNGKRIIQPYAKCDQYDSVDVVVDELRTDDLADLGVHKATFTWPDEPEFEIDAEPSDGRGFIDTMLSRVPNLLVAGVALGAAALAPAFAIPALVIAAHSISDALLRDEPVSYFTRPNGLLQAVGFGFASSRFIQGAFIPAAAVATGTLFVTETEFANDVTSALTGVLGGVIDNVISIIPDHVWLIILAGLAAYVIYRRASNAGSSRVSHGNGASTVSVVKGLI